MTAARALALGAIALAPARPAAAQLAWRAYGLDVAVAHDSGALADAALQNLLRLRLMAVATRGVVSVDVAAEQLLTTGTGNLAAGAALSLGRTGGGGDWLALDRTLVSEEHVAWRVRADRLAVVVRRGPLTLTGGRQAISWATTLLFTPADPFAPFDPADPFREYRGGVDAARLELFPGPFSEVEVVARGATYGDRHTATVLARGHLATGRLEVSGWGGVLHDAAASALAATVSVGGAIVRGEGALRRDAGATVTRFAVGADRSFEVGGRTLYAAVEYQHDGFGARTAADLPAVVLSAAYARGELQALGRDELAAQATYQAHPLVTLEALALWNAGDGSALLAPAASWSAPGNLTVRGGLFVGLGGGTSATGLPGSEYGLVPATGYVSGSVFF